MLTQSSVDRVPGGELAPAVEHYRRPVGDVMEDQLRHLLAVAQKPAVTIRIVPLDRGAHFGLRGPFVLLGFQEGLEDVLYLESSGPRRGDLFIAEDRAQLGSPSAPKVEDPGEVAGEYQDGFDRLLEIYARNGHT